MTRRLMCGLTVATLLTITAPGALAQALWPPRASAQNSMRGWPKGAYTRNDKMLPSRERNRPLACLSEPSVTGASVESDPFRLRNETYSFISDDPGVTKRVCPPLSDAPRTADSSTAHHAPKAATGHPLRVARGRSALRRALLKRVRGAHNVHLSCRSLTPTKVRCTVSLKRSGFVYQGRGTALFSHSVIRTSWTLKRAAQVKKPEPTETPPTTSSTPSSTGTAACSPLSNEGTCYEPGEYCRTTDHGLSGIAGDGETITCEDNDGWRWEPRVS